MKLFNPFKKKINNEILFYNSLKIVVQSKLKSKSKSGERCPTDESSPSLIELKQHQMVA